MPDLPDYYSPEQDVYLDQEYGVLKNIPNLTMQDELDRFEQTMFLINAPFASDFINQYDQFDLSHWQEIHRRCFEDVYAWAGQLRTIRIAKEATIFAYPENIEAVSVSLFEQLNVAIVEGHLEGVIGAFAELNILHPFREGNGRTQRLLFDRVFGLIGFEADYDLTNQDEMIGVLSQAYQGYKGGVVELFGRLLRCL